MARKITWEIEREGYGVQREVVAPTRSAALAIAEAEWLKDTAEYRGEFVDEDGVKHAALEMPVFKARKLH